MHEAMDVRYVIAFTAIFATVISTFVAVFLTRVELVRRIEDLRGTFKDFLVIAPKDPSGVKGVISAHLYEAMKEVCEAAKAQKAAEDRHAAAKDNKTSLISDVDHLWNERMDAWHSYQETIKRFLKVELAQKR